MGIWQKRHLFILLAQSSQATTSPHGSNLTFWSCSEQTEHSSRFIGGMGFDVEGGGVSISGLSMSSLLDFSKGFSNLFLKKY